MRRSLLTAILLVAVTLAGCTGSSNRDADSDGLFDQEEKAGWIVTVDLIGKRIERKVFSDPNDRDTDGDGLTDQEEFFAVPPLDPSNPDTDGDGLTDCQERRHKVRSECEDPDFSGTYDGGYGTDPTKADSDRGPSRYVNDHLDFIDQSGRMVDTRITWGDGITDGEEVDGLTISLPGGITRTVFTSPLSIDSDEDGLEDGEEFYLYGSDPLNPDTDHDGCEDGFDFYPLIDQQYRLRLDSFLLKQSQSLTGADLRFQFILGDNNFQTPSSGSKSVQTGQKTQIQGADPPAFRESPNCVLRTASGWLFFQVAVSHREGQNNKILDIFSQTGSPVTTADIGEGYWNPRTGELSWGLDHSQTMPVGSDGLIHWRGADGDIWFRLESPPA